MKLSPGMPALIPSSGEWNRHVEASDDWHRRKALGEGGGTPGDPLPLTVVKVRNDSGGDLAMGSVVELASDLIDTLDREQPTFAGATPNGTRTPAICIEPIPAGAIGRAQVSGRVPALVFVSHASHHYLRTTPNETILTSDYSGPIRLASPPSPTGLQLAWVILSPGFRIMRGVTQEEIEGHTSGNVLLTQPNKVEEVYNPFVTIAEDSPVLVAEVDGELTMWYPGAGGGGGGDERIWVAFLATGDMGATQANQAAGKVVEARGTGAPAADTDITLHSRIGERFDDLVVGSEGFALNWGTAEAPEYHIMSARRAGHRFKAQVTDDICNADSGDVTAKLNLTEKVWLNTGDRNVLIPSEQIQVLNPRRHAADAEGGTTADWVWCERIGDTKVGGKWQFEIYDVQKHEAVLLGELAMMSDLEGEADKAIGCRHHKVNVEFCKSDLEPAEPCIPLYPFQHLDSIEGSCGATKGIFGNVVKSYSPVPTEAVDSVPMVLWTAQTVVYQNSYDDGTWQYTPITIYVPCADAPGSPTPFVEGTDCEDYYEE